MLQRINYHLARIWRDFFVNTIGSSVLIHDSIRFIIYRIYGIKTETRKISPGCFIGGKNIHIGKGTRINYDCFLDNSAEIYIGKEVSIGMCSKLITSKHKIGDKNRRALDSYGAPIKIGDGTWICANVTIQPGVTIGEGCIIAVGSVVTKDCESNGFYGGVPAEIIKYLD